MSYIANKICASNTRNIHTDYIKNHPGKKYYFNVLVNEFNKLSKDIDEFYTYIEFQDNMNVDNININILGSFTNIRNEIINVIIYLKNRRDEINAILEQGKVKNNEICIIYEQIDKLINLDV